MRENTWLEKIIYLCYALLTDYFIATGAFLYVKFTLSSMEKPVTTIGIFWSIFIIWFLEVSVKNKMIDRMCYGSNSKTISFLLKVIIIVIATYLFGF